MSKVESWGLEESIAHREKMADLQIRVWALEFKINHISGPEDLRRVLRVALSLRGDLEKIKAAGLTAWVDKIIQKLERDTLAASAV